MEKLIDALSTEMHRIIKLQQAGKATKDDLYNLAVMTKCLENLKYA